MAKDDLKYFDSTLKQNKKLFHKLYSTFQHQGEDTFAKGFDAVTSQILNGNDVIPCHINNKDGFSTEGVHNCYIFEMKNVFRVEEDLKKLGYKWGYVFPRPNKNGVAAIQLIPVDKEFGKCYKFVAIE